MPTLHIRCGSDIRDDLKAAGIEGDFLEFADPVCRGLVPATQDATIFRDARLAYIVDVLGDPTEETNRKLDAAEAGLTRLSDYQRVVLWFEHDIYDQSVLIRLLATLADCPEHHDRIWLISTDRFPGIDRFIGLGQLTPEQLGTLWGNEQRVNESQYDLARRAWSTFRATKPGLSVVRTFGTREFVF
ncbi:MAG: DUF1835 domain-containing protein [Alphaproteobacteria bacterium]|jgi:hypothetical protein|nr:DUF1835 domain-containing protein [Rhodospirillaceae bacterium]MBT6510430.1 DUF1835 domain-containing protein [Rhodospirillaceae bacterium]MBT7611957.1 DUF1835 domain-containing protein [Rhodospirillaceae bacterium]MDG2482716.1 DUF1835 domain-containing protein [Alphaproteobacteria bacterium]